MRNLWRNTVRAVVGFTVVMPMLGLGCLPSAQEIRDLALTSIEGFIIAVVDVAISNAFSGLTG